MDVGVRATHGAVAGGSCTVVVVGSRPTATYFFVYSNKEVSKKVPPQSLRPTGTRYLLYA